MFQPFLRFNLNALHNGLPWAVVFQPFLRFNIKENAEFIREVDDVSTLLEIQRPMCSFLWVFKFFFGFL